MITEQTSRLVTKEVHWALDRNPEAAAAILHDAQEDRLDKGMNCFHCRVAYATGQTPQAKFTRQEGVSRTVLSL